MDSLNRAKRKAGPLAAGLAMLATTALTANALAVRTEEIVEQVPDAPPPCETIECASPVTDPPRPGPRPGVVTEAPRVVAWASGVDLNPLNGNQGGIYIAREDGTQ